MIYTIMEPRRPFREWKVGAIDERGQLHLAIFTGPKAEEHAMEYAQFKNLRICGQTRAR